MLTRNPLPFFAATAAALLATPSFAAPPQGAVMQVDGITNRVIDNVWANTDRYWHDGDYNRCVALLRVCVEADPSFDEAVSTGAWLLWSMGDKPAANALLQRSTAIAPNKWLAHYTFGEQLFTRREYKDVIPHMQKATQFPGAPSQAWKMLAHSYDKTGQYQKSLAAWQQVVKKYPQDVAGPVNLKRVEKKVKGG